MNLPGLAKSKFASIVLVMAVYLASLAVMDRGGFWITDVNNKLLQVQSILQGHCWLAWPGQQVDPQFQYNPLPPPFSVIRDGRLYSMYSVVFPAISAPLYRLMGTCGLYVLPMLGALLLLLAVARISQQLGAQPGHRHAAVLLSGLCTPIWFYSVEFWEHTLAACLCLWAASFCLDFLRGQGWRPLVLGACLAGLAVYLRDSLTVFCVALLTATALYAGQRRLKTIGLMAACMAAAVVPLLLLQWALLGDPFGFHLGPHLATSGGLAGHLADRPKALYNLLLAGGPELGISILAMSPFVAMFVICPRLSPAWLARAVPVLSLVGGGAAVVAMRGYFTDDSRIAWMFTSNSLYGAAPVLILAGLRPRARVAGVPPALGALPAAGLYRWLWMVALLHALLYVLAAPAVTTIGIHWGNRFLLELYPLLAILAAANLAAWWSGRGRRKLPKATLAVAAVMLISLAAQVYSIHLLRQRKHWSTQLNAALANRAEQVIVTSQWWAPQEMTAVFFHKPIFLATTQQQADELEKKLWQQGFRTCLVVQSAPLTKPAAGEEVVSDPLKYFSLSFTHAQIEPKTGKDEGAAGR